MGDSFTFFLAVGRKQVRTLGIGGWGYFVGGAHRGLRWVAALFLACFAVLVIAAVVPLSQFVYSVTLAAADVNTNVWLQLFTKEDPWLCLLCDI